MFIDKYGYPAKLRGGKGGTLHRFYEMSYGQASRTLNAYLNGSKRVKGDESLRVSLYLDNAMRGNLHIFVIDFDRFDENSGFFQSAKSLTDKVAFATDDIYRLGGSQRAKLQYHILAQHFPLVHVDEQDKADLEAFAAQADTGAAQLWLARMHWPQGHEKMVTFGQN
ncbi:MAG: hypothetical protein HFF18_10590, partial [Oscillospiraceae bacterium]|nr:hypothetical protein [Oscillospiraceae bacterium]